MHLLNMGRGEASGSVTGGTGACRRRTYVSGSRGDDSEPFAGTYDESMLENNGSQSKSGGLPLC